MSLEDDLYKKMVNSKVVESPIDSAGPDDSLMNDLYNKMTKPEADLTPTPPKKTSPKKTITDIENIPSSRRVAYNLAKGGNTITSGTTYLESKFPMGSIFGEGGFYTSPDEKYGEGFTKLSEDERRNVIIDYKEAEIARYYPILSAMSQDEATSGWEGAIGTIGKLMVDPVAWSPIGKTVKQAIAWGLGAGGYWSAVEDLGSREGVVDPVKAAQTAGLFAVGGGALVKTGQVVGKVINKRRTFKEANESMVEVNRSKSSAVAEGVPPEQQLDFMAANLNKTKKEIEEIIKVSDVPLQQPTLEIALLEKEMLKAFPKGTTGLDGAKPGWVENLIGSMSTTLSSASAKLGLKLSDYERKVSRDTARGLESSALLMKSLSRKPREMIPGTEGHTMMTTAHRLMFNEDFKGVVKLLKPTRPNIIKELAANQRYLKSIRKELNDVGYNIEKSNNKGRYFPRAVKDHDGLLDSLGVEQRTKLQKALDEAAKKQKKSDTSNYVKGTWGDVLSKEERDKITNQFISGGFRQKGSGKIKASKDRVFKNITGDMAKFYKTPNESIEEYIRTVAVDINKRHFIGKGNIVTKKGSEFLDVDESMGSLINKEIAAGRLSPEDSGTVLDVLNTRFIHSDKTPGKILQYIRNIGYATLIANPLSATRQLGDIGVSAVVNGVKNTAFGTVRGKPVTVKSLGLDDILSNDLGSALETSKVLGKSLSLSGFRATDRFGKNLFLKGNHLNSQNMVSTLGGRRAFINKHKEAWGEQGARALADDYANGVLSERVRLHGWNQLEGVQPISPSQMSSFYAKHENFRIAYALKSFGLKQLDFLRRSVVHEAKKGNYKKASANAAKFITFVAAGNGTITEMLDLIRGRGFYLEDIPQNSFDFLGSLLFISKYNLGKAYEGQGVQVIADTISPPFGFVGDMVNDATQIIKGEFESGKAKSTRGIPAIGEAIELFALGKREENARKEHIRRIKAGKRSNYRR
tara:strand:+ start:905 stop:3832 length:2928 start_codon:yes stop_codon:yes gene_type:complete